MHFTVKRETVRQAIIRESANRLAREYPHSALANYRQNVHSFVDWSARLTDKRWAYYDSLSIRGYKLLYTAIAQQAVIADKSINPVLHSNHSMLSADNPTHWSLSGKRSTFKHFD